MIGADTNLLVRHLVQDDPEQGRKVRALFDDAETRGEPVFLSHVVLCETCSVLETVYGFVKAQLISSLQALLDDSVFYIQDRPTVEFAFAQFRRLPGDFADHLLGRVASQAGAKTTYTFDRALAKSSEFTLLK